MLNEIIDLFLIDYMSVMICDVIFLNLSFFILGEYENSFDVCWCIQAVVELSYESHAKLALNN